MVGSLPACCARAASGHATTVLLENLMNSRRLMASPAPRTKSGSKDYHIFGPGIVPFVAPKRDRNHVRFGSKADIAAPPTNVRFTPKSGHPPTRLECPLCAKSGHYAAQQKERYSITSSARATNDGGTSRPSILAVVRLIMKSNLVGCSTGRSPGLAPCKILST